MIELREELTNIIKDHGEKKNKPKRELREINRGGNPAESKKKKKTDPIVRKQKRKWLSGEKICENRALIELQIKRE